MRNARFLVGVVAALTFAYTASPAMGRQDSIQTDGLKPFSILGSSRQITAGTAFNPSISVIFDGKYYTDNVRGEAAEIIEEAAGFDGHHGDEHGHELTRGFNLGETEIVFSASVDSYFDAVLTLAVEDDGDVEVEEAYGLTRSLPAGLQLKFGKFLSGIGYLNSRHPHEWDFADQALPYQLLFATDREGLTDVGVQLTWLPRLPVYTLFGVEALQGRNEGVANTLDMPEGWFGGLRERSGPRLFTGFAKVSPDLGFNHALQLGLFGGFSRLHQENHGDEILEGDTWFAGADAVYKYESGRAYGHGNWLLQGEYIFRVKDLRVAAVDDENEIDELSEEEKFTQDGFYVQGVYGFAPRWTAGLRLEMAGLTNRIKTDEGTEKFDDSRRYSANITFNPSEFSRLRVQVARGDIAVGGGSRERFNQVFFQYQLALGVHGAHRF